MTNIDMSKISEMTKPRGVQAIHLDSLVLALRPYLKSTTTIRATLESLGCGEGMATATSVCDGYWKDSNDIIRGVLECKNSVSHPADGARQGVAEAVNVAIHQLRIGVCRQRVLIPITSTTGSLMQFFSLMLLEPCFPMVVNLSKVLDLTCAGERAIAAGFLKSIHSFVSKPLETQSLSIPRITPGLSLEKYHVKHQQDFYLSRNNCIHESMAYFMNVMNHLWHDDECRRFVVFPLCVRQHRKLFSIVFQNEQEFRIGLPEESNLRDEYIFKGMCPFVFG